MRLKEFLTDSGREWWKYVPDQGIITSGVNTGSFIKNAVYSTDNDEILVYFATNSSATIKLNRINSSSITESWFNPADGTTIELGHTYNSSQEPLFTPPIGWEDAMLVLKAGNDTSDDDYKNIIHLYHLIL